MNRSLEVILAPAELEGLGQRDLSGAVCVVFDILRATSSILTAIAHGARSIVPVCEISQALRLRRADPELLLAGERDGLRIGSHQTGGTEFDLGNSPREYTPQKVSGRRIAMTTTNGTRALQACAGAGTVLIGSFLGIEALARWIESRRFERLVLAGSGTGSDAALEDTLAAGALAHRLWPLFDPADRTDAAWMARELYRTHRERLFDAVAHSRNGRRLLGIPELAEDVAFCLQPDAFSRVAGMKHDGQVVRLDGE